MTTAIDTARRIARERGCLQPTLDYHPEHLRAIAAAYEASAASAGAITYVLDRATSEPDRLGRHLEPFTEAWSRLVAAEAALLGVDAVAHRHWRDAVHYFHARPADGEEDPDDEHNERDSAQIRLDIATAWRDCIAGARSDVLVARGEDRNLTGSAPAAVIRRAGSWAVLRRDTDDGPLWSLTHGPTGMAAAQDDDTDSTAVEAILVGHLAALEAAGGRVLDGTDMRAVAALLRSRGAVR